MISAPARPAAASQAAPAANAGVPKPTVVPAATAPAAPRVPPPAPAVVPRPAAPAPTPTPAAAPTPAPAPRTAAAPTQKPSAPAGGIPVPDLPQRGWLIQVAATSTKTEADAIVKRLNDKGYPAFVTSPNATTYRVRVGGYRERRDAETVASKLRSDERVTPWITQ